MKNLHSFSSFTIPDGSADEIYESWKKKNMPLWTLILEAEGDDESEEPEEDWLMDRDFTSGEKAALARDFQILTKPQLAALYLKALGRFEKEEPGSKNRSVESRILFDTYVTAIPGIQDFCEEDWKTERPYITIAGLSDALGITSLTTVSRTVNKFYQLLAGIGETAEEALYPKVEEAFDFFKGKPVSYIQDIAKTAIQDPLQSTVRRSLIRSRGMTKEQMVSLGSSVYNLIRDLRKVSVVRKDAMQRDRTEYPFQDICKAQRNAVQKIAQTTGKTADEIKSFYHAFLIQNRMSDKFNWCP